MTKKKKQEIIASAGNTLIKRGEFYDHVGIFMGDGNVVHNSKKGKRVIKSPTSEFADGKQIEVYDKIKSENMQDVCKKALSSVGTPYNVVSYNCEHFANDMHGKGKKSEQVEQAATALGGMALTYLAKDMSPALRVLAGSAASSLADSEDPIRGAVRGAAICGSVMLIFHILSK